MGEGWGTSGMKKHANRIERQTYGSIRRFPSFYQSTAGGFGDSSAPRFFVKAPHTERWGQRKLTCSTPASFCRPTDVIIRRIPRPENQARAQSAFTMTFATFGVYRWQDTASDTRQELMCQSRCHSVWRVSRTQAVLSTKLPRPFHSPTNGSPRRTRRFGVPRCCRSNVEIRASTSCHVASGRLASRLNAAVHRFWRSRPLLRVSFLSPRIRASERARPYKPLPGSSESVGWARSSLVSF